jgi:hypothetical protein
LCPPTLGQLKGFLTYSTSAEETGLPGWRRSADRTCLQPNSLLTGNLTGKFMIFGLPEPLSMQETAVLQQLLVKFPTHINRENISRIREIFDLNREFQACGMNIVRIKPLIAAIAA